MNPHFIVHEPKDSVGVVVVDQIGAGEEVSGWVMETDETISMTATEVVPLGHKLALKDISVGETIFKYGQDIGMPMSWPYLKIVSPTLISFNASLWPSGTTSVAVMLMVSSVSITQPLTSSPAPIWSTTTTPTLSFGS